MQPQGSGFTAEDAENKKKIARLKFG